MTRLWARMMCGWCGRGFTADPERVPMFRRPPTDRPLPMCLPCWDTRNEMRVAANERADERPKAYPEDYS